MRTNIKYRLHKLFIRYPVLGHLGYEIIRFTKRNSQQAAFLEAIRARGFYPSSILDIGANRGEWSRNAKSVFKRSNCFLIEPQEEMKPFLDKFCADFPGSKWFLAGAGSAEGELTLTLWADFAGSSFIPGPTEKFEEILERRRVPILTIDQLIQTKEIIMPELVKIDVQGFELEVLKGGQECLNRAQVFIIECRLFSSSERVPVFHQIVNFMLENKYILYDILEPLRRPLDGALWSADFCFVKQDNILRQNTSWK